MRRRFLAAYVAPSSVAEIHLYHPQPYHDPRQAHLRLVTPRFLADVHRGLEPGGLFVVQTDNPDYWAYITRVVPVFFDFTSIRNPGPTPPRAARGARSWRGAGACGSSAARAAAATTSRAPKPWPWPRRSPPPPSAGRGRGASSMIRTMEGEMSGVGTTNRK